MKTRKNKKIRYAVVGQGYFAQAAVLPAFKHSKSAELAALVSGDMKKLRKLGKQYKVKDLYTYDQFDDLLRSGKIDAVYIALPNFMHREYTERAASAGIHVLCEKPMAVTTEECESMMRSAQENGVKLMIAYRLHFEKANLTAIDLIRKKKIGDPRLFNSVFTMPVKERNIRAKPEQVGGGPLHDIGLYCINAARYLFGQEPIEVFATSGDRPEGVKVPGIHESVSAMMRFPEGRIASFSVSYAAASNAFYEVVGTKGDICIENAYEYAAPMELFLTVNEKTKKIRIPKRDQVAPELDYFTGCILNDREPEPNAYEGMIDVLIIESMLRSIETGRPIPLSIAPRKQRPGLKQEIRRPAVKKEPELFHAEEPSKEIA